MADHSPTGYWAHYKILLPADRSESYTQPEFIDLPVVGWNLDGAPLVVNRDGYRVEATKEYPAPFRCVTVNFAVTASPTGEWA